MREDWRNRHGTLDKNRARKVNTRPCARGCGSDVRLPRLYCSPCSEDVRGETAARYRRKLRQSNET